MGFMLGKFDVSLNISYLVDVLVMKLFTNDAAIRKDVLLSRDRKHVLVMKLFTNDAAIRKDVLLSRDRKHVLVYSKKEDIMCN
eukprot:snap_masked-scaffold_52-processed-gene-1.68-mRNA-1 protein AED:1.00 eAED:1.00 QI:0/0/0/0/1/1/2/0/82